ncbi:MFS transporter [Dactylosporangium sp. NPDC000555]|uniref:MFS transporter n=1 Tax=Dactylosporangium sp. NPDC000555 TaxID=3154260 RepID=UPI003329012E
MTDSIRSAPTASSQPDPALAGNAETLRLTLALVMVALSLGFGSGTFLAVLPDLSKFVGVSAGQLNWLTSAQLLCTVVAVPIVGRLGDMFGHRRILFLAVAMTAIGGVLLALATSFAAMLIGRAMQGAIGSLFALGPALVRDRLPTTRGHTVITALAGSLLFGAVLGLLSAASLSKAEHGTQTALAISAVVYATAAALVLAAPESVVRARRSVDVPGAILLVVGLGCVVLGLSRVEVSGWAAPSTAGFLIAGLLVVAGWVRFEASTRHPLIDVRAMANRRVLPPAVIAFAFGVAQYGAQTAAVTFMASPADKLGYGLSMSIRDIAQLLAPCVIVGFIAALCAARLAAFVGERVAFVVGSVLLVLGFASMIAFHESKTSFALALTVQFAGQGIAQAMWPAVLSAAAEPTERGAITSVGQSLETLGGGLSTALFATILSSLVITGTDAPTVGAYVWVWLICGGISATIVPLAYVLRPSRRTVPRL